MKRLVLSEGRHSYQESTLILGTPLYASGHKVTLTGDASVLVQAADIIRNEALVFNTHREHLLDLGT
jgi:hypothetical protein